MDGRVLVVFLSLWSSGLWALNSPIMQLFNDSGVSFYLLTSCFCLSPESVRLVNETNLCSGRLEVKSNQSNQSWSSVCEDDFDLQDAEVVCRELGCGAPSVLQGGLYGEVEAPMWTKEFQCEGNESALLDCRSSVRNTCSSGKAVGLTCSESVRLVNGSNLCSGGLEVKSNQSWSSVCEDDFDLQDAEVVCRELGCGVPLGLQGGLYGEVEAPMWTKEFQCEGHESALLDCRRSGSGRKTCFPGKAVGLTCSDGDDIRLVGGQNHCTGRLELNHDGHWKAVDDLDFVWNLKVAAIMCRWLGCGSSVSTGKTKEPSEQSVWWIDLSCVESKSVLRECVTTSEKHSDFSLELTCLESVRLVNGSNLCSGGLEVKSNQSWSSVCEDDFDLQDAEVVCRELGCGPPSVLQGGLYGEVETPMWTKEFQCEGNESALLDCRRSDSERNNCSPGKAVGLICSETTRLVGEASRCAGTLEVRYHKEWRPVVDWDSKWSLKSAAAVCRQLDCGSAVSTEMTENPSNRFVWWIRSSCVQTASALRDCVILTSDINDDYTGLKVICSGLLTQPDISASPSTAEVSEAEQLQSLQVGIGSNFTITCSVEPQYQGGSFQLISPTFDTSQNYILPAVNHSAHFLCSAANPTHQGKYSCVYHVYVFSHNFSAESQPLYVTVSGPQRGENYAFKEDGDFKLSNKTGLDNLSNPMVKSHILVKDDTKILSDCPCVLPSPESVRLVNGTNLCSGRLEVKSNHSNQYNQSNQSNQQWSSVCEDDFDLQDAEVVCRELGCGAPSVLQGGLYGEVEDPLWTKEFQCEGHESALLDCRSLDSKNNTCLHDKAVRLICSEPNNVQLMGGSSHCAGELEVRQHGKWEKTVDEGNQWNLKTADVVCRQLDCGSAVSTGWRLNSVYTSAWSIGSSCLQSGSTVKECISTGPKSFLINLEVNCSDSVRLVNGESLCSGRLKVKSNQQWSSVCEDDFDLQDAEVVCRELGCGAPLIFQGGLYGEMEAPLRSKEFQCEGHESTLLDCRSSDSERNTCSPGKAVGLTCSEPDDIKLGGGASPCVGRLEMRYKGDWRPVDADSEKWDMMTASAVCRQLDCGSALSTRRHDLYHEDGWIITSSCDHPASAIRECVLPRPDFWNDYPLSSLEVTCSGNGNESVSPGASLDVLIWSSGPLDLLSTTQTQIMSPPGQLQVSLICLSPESVRLVKGTSLCSGRLEVKSNQSNRSWSSVCEDDFDLQDAEVVCRELGCGPPSVLQGGLYGEVEAPMWTKEFQCEGNESALLDCRRSESARKICSLGKAVGLTCSEPDNVRLVGGGSRCDGMLEMKQHGEWRPPQSFISHCPDFLTQPNISFSTYIDGAKQEGLQVLMGSNFTISCSIQSQYPGGFFQLILTTSAMLHNYTQPAGNHSADFLFSEADHTLQGDYRCVYHIHVFSQNFSSESRALYISISGHQRAVQKNGELKRREARTQSEVHILTDFSVKSEK
ncbi:hypothetical protein L3Q82_018499, partial [Scortum barcoo]